MFNHQIKDKQLIVKFTGRMDTQASQLDESELYKIIEENNDKSCAFDLADVDYIASAFLRICLTAAEKLGHSNFSIINVQPQIKKIFKVAGIDKIFGIS